MNAYETAVALGIDGDANVVTVLQSLAVSDVTRSDLNRFMRVGRFLIFDGAAWSGSIQTLLVNGSIPEDNLDDIVDLKAIMVGTGGDGLATTDPVWSLRVFAFVTLMAGISQDASLVEQFYAMAGGRPFADLTIEQYEEQSAAALTASGKQGLLNRIIWEEEQFDARANQARAAVASGTATTSQQVLDILHTR
jgi:hypothetical protein